MRVACNDSDDRAGLRSYVQFNKYTYIQTYIHITYIRNTYMHRMTRMTGPDCAVKRNLINIHTYIHTYILHTAERRTRRS